MKTIFDTDIKGRTRTIAYTDENGYIENITITESFNDKGKHEYICYSTISGRTFNRFTKSKKEQAILDKVNSFLGIEF